MASIYKQRGRFIAQVNVRGVRRSKSFDKISDARQWAKRAEVELADAPRAATRRHTISDAIHAHLTNGRPRAEIEGVGTNRDQRPARAPAPSRRDQQPG